MVRLARYIRVRNSIPSSNFRIIWSYTLTKSRILYSHYFFLFIICVKETTEWMLFLWLSSEMKDSEASAIFHMWTIYYMWKCTGPPSFKSLETYKNCMIIILCWLNINQINQGCFNFKTKRKATILLSRGSTVIGKSHCIFIW